MNLFSLVITSVEQWNVVALAKRQLNFESRTLYRLFESEMMLPLQLSYSHKLIVIIGNDAVVVSSLPSCSSKYNAYS